MWHDGILREGELFYLQEFEDVSKSFRTESIKKYTLTFGITRWKATQRVMVAKLTTLTHIIAIKLYLMAERYIICSSRSRRPVRKFSDTPSYHKKFLPPKRRTPSLHTSSPFRHSNHPVIRRYKTTDVGKALLNEPRSDPPGSCYGDNAM